MKFLTNLNLVYVSYTQGGKKYFKDLKGLKGVSLPGQQQFERAPPHLYVWQCYLGLHLAAVEKGSQEGTREKGACVSNHKTTRQEKGCSQDAEEGEAWRREREETLPTFSSHGGPFTGHMVTAVDVVTATVIVQIVSHSGKCKALQSTGWGTSSKPNIWGTRKKLCL